MNDSQHDMPERLARAYDDMLAHARETIGHLREDAVPNVRHTLEKAREKTSETAQITREEAEKVRDYLERDLIHAALFLNETRKGLAEWLRFDIEMLEQRTAHALSEMVDHTRLALDRLADEADEIGWSTGEIAGAGTLECKSCGQLLQFHQAGHIPPCPKCRHTQYRRQHLAE